MKEDLHSHRDTWSVVEQLAELFSTSCGSGICVGQTCDFAPTPVFPWYLSLMEPILLNIIPLRSQCHLRTVSSDPQFSWRLQLSSDISLSSVLFYTLSVNGDTGPPIWRLLKPFIVFDCERALAPRPDLFSCHVSGRFWGVWAASCVASVFIKEDRESTPGSAEWFWIFSVRNTGELLLAQETAGDKVTSKYRHMWIDIRSLDFDMFYFSGSKCTGTGVCGIPGMAATFSVCVWGEKASVLQRVDNFLLVSNRTADVDVMMWSLSFRSREMWIVGQ